MDTRTKTKYGWFLLSAASTPFIYIGLTYLPTLITYQAKLVASRNPEWIKWKMPDGTLCGPALPRYNYNRPNGYDSKCLWVPINPTVLGNDINYSSIASYAFTTSSLISILCNIFIVPFADFA